MWKNIIVGSIVGLTLVGFSPSARAGSQPEQEGMSNQAQGQGQEQGQQQEQTQQGMAATIHVNVPLDDAQVYFDGNLMQQQGVDRVFTTGSTALEVNRSYQYQVRAVMNIDGQDLDTTVPITFKAGDTVNVSFNLWQLDACNPALTLVGTYSTADKTLAPPQVEVPSTPVTTPGETITPGESETPNESGTYTDDDGVPFFYDGAGYPYYYDDEGYPFYYNASGYPYYYGADRIPYFYGIYSAPYGNRGFRREGEHHIFRGTPGFRAHGFRSAGFHAGAFHGEDGFRATGHGRH
jgi:uncharacterized protein (TIGR03000 family)